MNPVLHGLAANTSLPPEAVDRLLELVRQRDVLDRDRKSGQPGMHG
ncbi:hypothetical protein ACPCUK_28540 [Streptomyces arboris]